MPTDIVGNLYSLTLRVKKKSLREVFVCIISTYGAYKKFVKFGRY